MADVAKLVLQANKRPIRRLGLAAFSGAGSEAARRMSASVPLKETNPRMGPSSPGWRLICG